MAACRAIVGIGASAGGIETLARFFSAMPADSGCGFVVILHLDPTRKSALAPVLSRQTTMPVVEERVTGLFHFGLRDGGHLFLGNAEGLGQHDELFHTVSKKWRIYRRHGPVRHDLLRFPVPPQLQHQQLTPWTLITPTRTRAQATWCGGFCWSALRQRPC